MVFAVEVAVLLVLSGHIQHMITRRLEVVVNLNVKCCAVNVKQRETLLGLLPTSKLTIHWLYRKVQKIFLYFSIIN
jgi:hypothetical protein